MNYEQTDMGAYQLHIIQTKKFKTVTVEVNFRREVKKEEITIRNLLKSVMLNTTKNFKTERELIKETENLYDLKLISSNIRIGNQNNLSFKVRFLNEKYTEKSMNEYSIAFLAGILFEPDVSENQFKKEEVQKCKNKLEKSIQRLYDNKLKYALIKLLESTKDKPYSHNAYGDLDELEKITPALLFEYYKSVLKDDYVDIFVVGDVESSEIKKIFKKYFKLNTFKKIKNNILVEELLPRKRIKKIVEKDKANQSQLTLLCSLNNLSEFERKYSILVYNEMLGGSNNSLLFDTVREKKSYAYYVNSNQKAYDNTLMIYAGIEPNNSENVLKLIRKTMLNINKGIFEEQSLENAKETIISSIKASTDSPTGIINTYYAKILLNSEIFEKRIENIKKITKDDIVNLSKKITMHTMYLLEGNSEEDTNEEN
mgnify:CR=1 FL=1